MHDLLVTVLESLEYIILNKVYVKILLIKVLFARYIPYNKEKYTIAEIKMKRNLTLVFVCMILLVSLAGCRDANLFEETTLTVVNSSGHDIDFLSVYGNVGVSSRGEARPNALGSGEVIAPGEHVIIGLPPVLADNSSLQITIELDVDSEYYSCDVTYEEGSEVVLTLFPAHGEDSTNFTISGGSIAEEPYN